MSKRIDLKGKRFNRLVVIKDSKKEDKNGNTIWICLCSCGNLMEIRQNNLISNHTKSCGCLRKEMAKKRISLARSFIVPHKGIACSSYKHGGNGTRLYGIWGHMKGRCYNQNYEKYKKYGGRGIKVCPEWKNDFASFRDWALDNKYQNNLTIDRIDNNGDYKPSNCQWITNIENAKKGNKLLREIKLGLEG